MKGLLAACLVLVSPPLLAQAPPPPQAPAPPNLDPLVAEGVVAAPVAEVWRVFSTADGYTKLGVAKADMDFRPGGLIRSTYDPAQPLDGEGAIQTEIVAFEPMRVLVTRIHRPPKGFPFAEAWRQVWTVISLADLGEGRTNVRMAMVGYGPDPESQAMRGFFRTGNDWVLKKLQSAYTAVSPTVPAHADEPLAPVDVQAVVAADREKVWRTFTTAEGWRDFLGAQAAIGAQPGEPFEVFFNPQAPEGERGSEGCRVLGIIPGEMISYTWNAPPKFPFARGQHTWVVVTFEALSPATTRVRLRELGFRELVASHPERRAEVEQVRAYFATAWPQVLSALAARLKPGPPSAPAPATASR
jgi:uncharacterized protein YndB with AHSA1/START domain